MAAGEEYLARRLQPFTTTIFATMSELAATTGAVNLGQGFPDTDGPEELREVAVAAIREGRNQYPPGNGIPELRHAVAAHQRAWYGLEPDPDTGVLVTVGATEAIAATLLALCEPGDEVVMFEPTYDSYAPARRWRAPCRGSSACTRPTGASTPPSWPPPSGRARGSCCSTRRTTRPARCSRPPSWRRSPTSASPTTSWR